MSKFTLQRIPFSKDADIRMRGLKGSTGITPNYLCRMGFCLSLEETGNPSSYLDNLSEIGREINRVTLLGDNDQTYVALLKTWMYKNKLDYNNSDEINNCLIAHMNRGVELICSRVESLTDLSSLAS